jgi:hypothetical protein
MKIFKSGVLRMGFFIVCLFFFGLQTNAQNCDFKFNETDEFTGSMLVGTHRHWIYADFVNGFGIYFTKVDSTYFVHMEMSFANATVSLMINEGDKLYYILSDGSKIELTSPGTIKTNFNAGNSFITGVYDISREDLESLSKNTITKFRLQAGDRNFDKEPGKAKNLLKVKNDAGCILKK